MFLENISFAIMGVNFIHGDLIHGYEVPKETIISVVFSLTSFTYVIYYFKLDRNFNILI